MKISRVVLLLLLFTATICLLVSCKNEPETKKYNVSFYDGDSVLFHQTVESGKKVVRPTDPQKAGFVFDNWYQDTSLTQVYDFNSPVNSDKPLYAKWNTTPTPVSEKYSVTYNANGATFGTAPVDSNSPYTSGSTVTVLGKGDLIHTSKSFAGWNTASDGTGTSYVAGQSFVITCNTVLYAKWSEKNPSPSAPVIPSTSITCATTETSTDASISDVDETMEYSTDGGTTWIPVTGTQITGLSAGIVKVRVKETDTTLAGEITDVDLRCENTSVPSGLAYVAPTTIGGSDGKITGVDDTMEYSTDNGATWTACTEPEITGLSAGDVQIRYAATDKKKASTPTTITVEDKVTITYNANGATSGTAPVDSNSPYTSGSTVQILGKGDLVYSLKSFAGWNTVSDGSGTDYVAGQTFVITCNTVLYAKWSDKSPSPSAPVIPSTSIICATSETSTDASISDVDETMEYSTDGGTTWIPVTGTQITGLGAGIVKVRVKETETTLAGEITDVDLRCENTSVPSGLAYVAPTTIGGNDGKITGVSTAMEYSIDNGTTWIVCTGTEITGLSARDVQIRYSATEKRKASTPTTITVEDKVTITFDGNGGTGSMDTVFVQKGTNYTVPACGFTANTGYEFDIWNDGTSDVAVNSVITVNSNITLTAKWNPKTYTITYKDKGNVAFSGEHETGYPTTHTYGTATTLKTATKTGYVFGGWFTTSECTGSAITSLDVTAYSDSETITLYAKWNPETYTITYKDKGNVAFSGTHESGYPQTHTYGTATTLKTATRTGYTFGGWFVASDCSGSAITNLGATSYTGTITLYAKWDLASAKLIDGSSFNTKLTNKLTDPSISSVKFRTGQTAPPTIADSDLVSSPDSEGNAWFSTEGSNLYVNTDCVKYMANSCENMFSGCSQLISLDFSGFDTSQVTNMECMFDGCSDLTALDLSGFDTSQVTSMSTMFFGCTSLTTLDVLHFNTSQVTNMSWMFSDCESLTALNISGFDTSKVTDMQGMFSLLKKITFLNTGDNFSVGNVTNHEYIFDDFAVRTGEHTVVVPNTYTMAAFYGDGTNGWIGTGWTQDGINLKKTI